jgi:hypothetical protein
MFILALDLATKTGWASGLVGEVPKSGSWLLRRPKNEPEVGWENLGCRLRDLFTLRVPDLVIYERAMSVGAMQEEGDDGKMRFRSSPQAIQFLIGIVGALHGVTGPYGVKTASVPSQTWRKHLLGAGKIPKGEAKPLTIRRVHQLGLMPIDCRDDNRADAIGVWEYAAGRYGRATPAYLQMHAP